MSSRKIEDLCPELQEKYKMFDAMAQSANVSYRVTCTFRSQEEQDADYAKGRTAPGPIITWTLHSQHTLRRAFDVVCLTPSGRVITRGDDPAYATLGKIAQSVGLQWGIMVKGVHKDLDHFQLAVV